MPDIGLGSTAAAWVIARNLEQDSSFSEQQKKYRKGLVAGGGSDISEDGELPGPDDNIILGVDYSDASTEDDDISPNPGSAVDPFIIPLDNEAGIYLKYFKPDSDPDDPNNYFYVHFYLDDYYYKGTFRTSDPTTANLVIWKNQPCIDIIDGSGQITTQTINVHAFERQHLVYRRVQNPIAEDNYLFITKYQIRPEDGRINYYVVQIDNVYNNDREYWDTSYFNYWDTHNYQYVGAKTSYP